MKNCVSILIVLAGSALSGCASPPTAEMARKANYGPRPTTAQMVSMVKERMSKSLIDPYSAVYPCSQPTKAWVIAGSGSQGNVESGRTYYGWLSTCSINAKNRFGGYVGAQEYTFMIVDANGTPRLAHFDGYQAADLVRD